MKKKLVILLKNKDYEERLCQYVRRCWQEHFVIAGGLEEGEILLTDTGVELSESAQEQWSHIFYFSDVKSEQSDLIYRYQKAGKVMQELLFKCSGDLLSDQQQRISRCVIFYTPGGNAAQTLAARQQAVRMSTTDKVLYVYYGELSETMESEEGLLHSEVDLSVLCYYVHRYGIEAISKEKIYAGVERSDHYDYLRMFHHPTHVIEMKEEFGMLLQRIIALGLYDVVLLDLAILPMGLEALLSVTKELYSIIPGDDAARIGYDKRMKQWKDYLTYAGLNPVDIMLKEREYKP